MLKKLKFYSRWMLQISLVLIVKTHLFPTINSFLRRA